MQELEYNPSKKDLTDAKIHHLLAEELCKPFRRVCLLLILSFSLPDFFFFFTLAFSRNNYSTVRAFTNIENSHTQTARPGTTTCRPSRYLSRVRIEPATRNSAVSRSALCQQCLYRFHQHFDNSQEHKCMLYLIFRGIECGFILQFYS